LTRSEEIEMGDFELVRHCGSFEHGPLRTIQARWQRVRGELRADLRSFVEDGSGKKLATRSGLSLPPDKLEDARGLIDALLAAREEVLDQEAATKAG
jgi:hypothetical protein